MAHKARARTRLWRAKFALPCIAPSAISTAGLVYRHAITFCSIDLVEILLPQFSPLHLGDKETKVSNEPLLVSIRLLKVQF